MKIFPSSNSTAALGFRLNRIWGVWGKIKYPFSCTGLGRGMGKGWMAPLPHCCGSSRIPILSSGFLCWLVGSLDYRARLILASLDTYSLGIFLIWLPRSLFHPSRGPIAPRRGGQRGNKQVAELLSHLSQWQQGELHWSAHKRCLTSFQVYKWSSTKFRLWGGGHSSYPQGRPFNFTEGPLLSLGPDTRARLGNEAYSHLLASTSERQYF